MKKLMNLMPPLLATVFTTMTLFAKEGGGGPGGGTEAGMALKRHAVQMIEKLNLAYGDEYVIKDRKIPLAKLLKNAKEAKVGMKANLKDNKGYAVDALNYPQSNFIEINSAEIEKAKNGGLMIHEVLGLAEVKDDDYEVSNPLFDLYQHLENFPFGSTYQSAHQVWARSSFASHQAALKFLTEIDKIKCMQVSWSKTTPANDPNRWFFTDNIPVTMEKEDPLTGLYTQVMMLRFVNGTRVTKPSEFKDGKLISEMDGTDRFKMAFGRENNKLFVRVQHSGPLPLDYEEIIYVCKLGDI